MKVSALRASSARRLFRAVGRYPPGTSNAESRLSGDLCQTLSVQHTTTPFSKLASQVSQRCMLILGSRGEKPSGLPYSPSTGTAQAIRLRQGRMPQFGFFRPVRAFACTQSVRKNSLTLDGMCPSIQMRTLF